MIERTNVIIIIINSIVNFTAINTDFW